MITNTTNILHLRRHEPKAEGVSHSAFGGRQSKVQRAEGSQRFTMGLVDAVHDVNLQRVQIREDRVTLGTGVFGNAPLILPVGSYGSRSQDGDVSDKYSIK